jgi:hypothetical protein
MTSIGTINLAGLFKNINQQFSFVESFKELVDNSLDANAKNVTIRISPTEFVFSDNGEGLSETNIVKKMMQLFLETQNNEGKRGNKGIGLKAALIKLTNYKNIDILTKTLEGDLFRVCFPIQTVIEKNDISLIKYNKATTEDEKVWEQFTDDSSICNNGTIIYSLNREICQSIYDQVHLEELTHELEMVYSNFLHKTEIKCKYYQTPDILCKQHPLFNLVNNDIWKTYRIRISSLRKEFIFNYSNRWYQVFPSGKKDKIKEFTGEFNNFTLKLNCYWWYVKDSNVFNELLGDVEKTGFYSCREQKFSELGFKLPEKAQGDFSLQREITNKSVWILEFGSKLDELMGTIANKSKLSKTHMDPYIYSCIVEFARWLILKAIEEISVDKVDSRFQPQPDQHETQRLVGESPSFDQVPQTVIQLKSIDELSPDRSMSQQELSPLCTTQSLQQTNNQPPTKPETTQSIIDEMYKPQDEDEKEVANDNEDDESDPEEEHNEDDEESFEEDTEEEDNEDNEDNETGEDESTIEADEVIFYLKQKVQRLQKLDLSHKHKQACKDLSKKLMACSYHD